MVRTWYSSPDHRQYNEARVKDGEKDVGDTRSKNGVGDVRDQPDNRPRLQRARGPQLTPRPQAVDLPRALVPSGLD